MFATPLEHYKAVIFGCRSTNYGQIRQLNLSVSIIHPEEIDRALTSIYDVLKSNERVLKEPQALVGLSSLANRAMRISVNPWVKVSDYGIASAEINRAIVEKLREAGIEYRAAVTEIRIVGGAAAG